MCVCVLHTDSEKIRMERELPNEISPYSEDSASCPVQQPGFRCYSKEKETISQIHGTAFEDFKNSVVNTSQIKSKLEL